MRLIFLLSFIVIAQSVIAQETDYIWEPQYSYTWKQSDRLIWNAKLSTRKSFDDVQSSSFLKFIQPSLSAIFRTSPRVKIGVGYNYRYRNPLLSNQLYEHRFTQQIGFVTFIGDRRVSHRFRTEQRFRSESFQHRYRYRISYDFPLTGSKLDAGERYLILKNEIINAITERNIEFENRISVGLGWFINSSRKFETGAEYRTQDIWPDSAVNHLIAIFTSFYFNR